jgi:DNA-directed RNA polymerase subunit RPC12/RpoP
MGEFHIKRIVLPSGKTVEIVYYQTTGSDPVISDVHEIEAGAELHVRQIELCTRCGGDQVHPTDWNEVEELRWQLALRCPDCEYRHVETYDAAEVERYDDVLNDATDRLIEELDRVTRENMSDAIDRFRSALESDGIMPFDF